MSARPVEVILCCPHGCIMDEGYCAASDSRLGGGDGAAELRRFRAMPEADRLALARALLPPGWVVGRVPEPMTNPSDYRWGWNACRAAFIASASGEDGA